MPTLDPIIRLGWQPAAGVRDRVIEFDDSLRERVLSFEFTDKASGADKGKLSMDNSDLSLYDHEAFSPNARLHVQWGYAHDIYPTQVFTVEKIKGFRKLDIEGSISAARGLLGIQRTRTFENATEFDVADEIARELGFITPRSRAVEVGDIEVERRGITQAGETDMAFLQRLARRVGATFFIRGNVFHFHERTLSAAPTLTVTYFNDQEGQIIGEPQIEHTIQGRPGRVQRRGRSPRQRRETTGDASNREDRERPSLGEELPMTDASGFDWESIADDLGTPVEELPQSTLPSEEEAQADVSPTTAETDEEATSQARQRFRGGERSAIKMNLVLQGNPQVRADNNIRVAGLGEKYSGNYNIEEAVHTVSPSGYSTKVKLKRNATSRSRGTGRSRRRAVNQGTNSVPAGADLPYSSEFNVWDCQGDLNVDEPPDSDVRSETHTDADGAERVSYFPSTGDEQTREPEPWEEDW